MKEIDQRSKNNLHIQCNCGSHHFLEFGYSADDYNWKEEKSEKVKKPLKKNIWKHYYISFVEHVDWNFWDRLKICFRYLFKRTAQICYTGIGITSKDMYKIKKHFEKYQQL